MKYNIGDIIEIHSNHKAIPGVKNLNKGRYQIINIRPAFFGPKQMVYVFRSIRKNSKNEFCFNQTWVENNSNLVTDKI